MKKGSEGHDKFGHRPLGSEDLLKDLIKFA